jgi:hypothetical protein
MNDETPVTDFMLPVTHIIGGCAIPQPIFVSGAPDEKVQLRTPGAFHADIVGREQGRRAKCVKVAALSVVNLKAPRLVNESERLDYVSPGVSQHDAHLAASGGNSNPHW